MGYTRSSSGEVPARKLWRRFAISIVLPALLLISAAAAAAAELKTVPGISCRTPPLRHCEEPCNDSAIDNTGNAFEPLSGRGFFLDYPCDLRSNEKVIFILNLHGTGSVGNWQRHYFPAADYKEQYRLVIATPTAATVGYIAPLPIGFRAWDPEADDRYLENIVTFVLEQFGRKNIKSFWIAGHSQGGITANRMVCSDFFKNKVDGWLSLSGGRIGAVVPSRKFDAVQTNHSADLPTHFGEALMPACNLSFIFVSGELEIVSLPQTSPWADKYKCGQRVLAREAIDTTSGYVKSEAIQENKRQTTSSTPYVAEIFLFPKCKRSKLVADVLRLNRDHGDGLGPLVTKAIIELIRDAPGGKIRESRWSGSLDFTPAGGHR